MCLHEAVNYRTISRVLPHKAKMQDIMNVFESLTGKHVGKTQVFMQTLCRSFCGIIKRCKHSAGLLIEVQILSQPNIKIKIKTPTIRIPGIPITEMVC